MASFDFDLIVLGGGAGGMTSAGIASNARVRAMLIEREKLGGDCKWNGRIPSKSLLHRADVSHPSAQRVRILGDRVEKIGFFEMWRPLNRDQAR